MTLDDFMRAMWRTLRQAGRRARGYVDRPYTIADAEARLAEVSGDRAFARDFFARYIQGHDVADYAPLAARAGFVAAEARRRPRVVGRSCGWTRAATARHIAADVPASSPAYAAGLDHDDAITPDRRRSRGVARRSERGDQRGTSQAIACHVNYVDRTGASKTATVTLVEDPHAGTRGAVAPTPRSTLDAPAQTDSVPQELARGPTSFPICARISTPGASFHSGSIARFTRRISSTPSSPYSCSAAAA